MQQDQGIATALPGPIDRATVRACHADERYVFLRWPELKFDEAPMAHSFENSAGNLVWVAARNRADARRGWSSPATTPGEAFRAVLPELDLTAEEIDRLIEARRATNPPREWDGVSTHAFTLGKAVDALAAVPPPEPARERSFREAKYAMEFALEAVAKLSAVSGRSSRDKRLLKAIEEWARFDGDPPRGELRRSRKQRVPRNGR